MSILKKSVGFFESIKISVFDFKSYLKFVEMDNAKVFLNRFIFVFLICLIYLVPFTKNVEIIKDLNMNKQNVFEEINYSNGVLNIKNSPTVFTSNDFILIGDTRDNFNEKEFKDVDSYKTAIYLLKNSFVVRQGLKEIEFKYSDLVKLSFSKTDVFRVIEVFNQAAKMSFILVPFARTIRYFVFAVVTSVFAFMFSIIMRFRFRFSQIYKMILFAQGVPFLIISMFDLISIFNGTTFVYPSHILQFLTLTLFLIAMFSIKKDNLMKNLKNRK